VGGGGKGNFFSAKEGKDRLLTSGRKGGGAIY